MSGERVAATPSARRIASTPRRHRFPSAGDEDLAVESGDESGDDGESDESDDDDGGGAVVVDPLALAQAASLLASHPDAARREASRALLLRAAANLEADPANDKFRKLRKANAKISERVVGVRGAPDVLACLGFVDKGDHYLVEAAATSEVVSRAKAVAAALRL